MLNNINDLLLVAGQQEGGYEPYKETLEKITLTGAEYFDLGYKVSDFEIGDTIRFEGIIKGTEASSIPSSGSQLVFSLGNDGGQWLGKAQNGTKYAFGSSNTSTISFNEEVLADVTIALSGSASKPTFTISGSVTSDTATSTITQRSSTPTYYDFPLLFGAGTKSTGEKSYGGDYTIKCGKIYINGTMTKDYVPALDSQMRPCLYDKISKTFIYAKKISDGTTTYGLGFKRWNKFDVDYIENTGTAYIPFTDITPSSTTGMNIEYAYLENGTGSAGVIGSYYSGSGARKDCLFVSTSVGNTQIANNNPVMLISCGASIGTTSGTGQNFPPTADKWFNGQINWLNSGKLYWTDFENEMSGDNGTNAPVTNQLRLFSRYMTSTSSYGNCKARCRKLQFSEGSEIIRSYIPVVWHNSDTTAIATLYDEVYNKMTTPTGTLKAYIENTLGVPYEVGMYVQTIKSSNTANAGYVVELGEYPQDGMGYHIKTTTDSTSSNYLFGSRLTTSGNLAIITLLGSSTGATISSGVMSGSITWKSGTTTWTRSGNGTTYECSIQTYKDGNTYKFDAIGYNYTLGKDADRQTQTYPNPIDGQQNAPMLLFGAVNTINILFGSNSHYFVEWNLPNVRHTLLPVINAAHTQFCFIDNKSKVIYEFTKIGAPSPSANNVKFKQLDGTIITGTLT